MSYSKLRDYISRFPDNAEFICDVRFYKGMRFDYCHLPLTFGIITKDDFLSFPDFLFNDYFNYRIVVFPFDGVGVYRFVLYFSYDESQADALRAHAKEFLK